MKWFTPRLHPHYVAGYFIREQEPSEKRPEQSTSKPFRKAHISVMTPGWTLQAPSRPAMLLLSGMY